MKPSELAQLAVDAISKGLENVQLVLPKPATGRRHMVVFAKPRLMGEVCCENADGHTVVWVKALDLLAWSAAAGMVTVKTTSGEVIS